MNERTEKSRNARNPKRASKSKEGHFNAELGPGIRVERVSIGTHTHPQRGEQERRLDEAMADDTQLHSRLDYILVDRKHLRCSRDAEASDMIRMGSGHRSVMAQFL